MPLERGDQPKSGPEGGKGGGDPSTRPDRGDLGHGEGAGQNFDRSTELSGHGGGVVTGPSEQKSLFGSKPRDGLAEMIGESRAAYERNAEADRKNHEREASLKHR